MRSLVLYFIAVATIGVAALLLTSPVSSQSGGSFVVLQGVTPGEPQLGNTNVSGTAIANQFKGNGLAITNLSASNLTSGTVSDSLLSSNVLMLGGSQTITGTKTFASRPLFSSSGVPFGVTATGVVVNLNSDLLDGQDGAFYRNAGSIDAGTLLDARLSSNVALLSSAQVFTGVNTFQVAPSFSASTPFAVTSATLVTNLNADLLDGLSSSSFLQSDPTPLSLTANSATHILSAKNTRTSGINMGIYGENASPDGIAIKARATAISGTNYGVYAESAGHLGVAVYGLATDDFTSGSIGVYGRTNGTNGTGVRGRALASTGGLTFGVWGSTAHPNSAAIYGQASSDGATDSPIGVEGYADTATLGYGLFALGDSGASGVKTFRIDHPKDPMNKYLMHYSSESPFPQNFYVGNVVTDMKGYAWVELPEYFDSINTNFKYLLTVVDDEDAPDFVHAKVSKKIVGNRFQLRTSMPNIEVSWIVLADRNDQRIEVNRPVDVRDKNSFERGKLQHPEYFGLPPSKGLRYLDQLDNPRAGGGDGRK